MTPRPSVARSQRPLSAIFIGSLGSSSSSTPPGLPKLPEPPSPEGSAGPSTPPRSGLPSPPATNSSGSGNGSNGDEPTNTGSLRERKTQRPYSVSNVSDMYYGRNKSYSDLASSANNNPLSDEDDDPNDYERDEDSTARFDLHRRRSTNTVPSEHASALQRVKSLTERNRMILDKLSSMSRHNSPVPPNAARSTATPPHTPSPTPASASASRPPSSVRTASFTARPEASSLYRSRLLANNHGNSGSETERESSRSVSRARPISHTYSSSESMSNTPTSQHSEVILPFIGDRDSAQARRISAPISPAQAESSRPGRLGDRSSSPPPSPGPSKVRTPRKRGSVAVTAAERDLLRQADEGGNDVISAALAAAASTRRSSPAGSDAAGSVSRRGLSRNALPMEFIGQNGRGQEGGRSEQAAPYAPHRDRSLSRHRRSPSPSTRASTSQTAPASTNGRYSPTRRPIPQRTSTVRELTRRHQTRWASEDLSASTHADVDDAPAVPSRSTTSQSFYSNSPGRRPTVRGGSDGPLSPPRSLLGEGLRAAGITKRRDAGIGDDPFASPHPVAVVQAVSPRRTHSTGANSVINGGAEWESPLQTAPATRLGDRNRRRSVVEQDGQRSVTSMAALHHDSPANISRAPGSTTKLYQSTRALHRERAASSVYDDPGGDASMTTRGGDSKYSSPFSAASSRPSTAASGSTRDAHAEHRRLMLEALSMFESHLSRLPPMGQTTTSTIPEVFQSSQQAVHALDLLNSSLRAATGEALKLQVDAEVADSDSALSEIAEIWHRVGDDHREHLKISDELVRTMTQLLLGVGKVIRDVAGASQSQHHLRSISMDEDIGRRLTPDVTSTSSDKRSSDGRASRETRRSWDPREAMQPTVQRLANIDRTSNTPSSRAPPSAYQPPRSSASSSIDARSPNEGPMEQTPPASRPLSSALSSIGPRRLYTPRDRIASDTSVAPMMSSFDSQETIHGYEPSPTPAGRQSAQSERTRALPPLAIPPSLPTLPSESLLSRRSAASMSDRSRRKVSTNSQVTVRAEPSLPSVIKQPTATTAVTPTTVDFAEAGSSLSRSNSESSVHSNENDVVISRPSASSSLGSIKRSFREDFAALHSPMSGSETERPRTFAARTFTPRTRASLESSRPDSIGRASQASTLTLTRTRERRRTITEIFSQAQQ